MELCKRDKRLIGAAIAMIIIIIIVVVVVDSITDSDNKSNSEKVEAFVHLFMFLYVAVPLTTLVSIVAIGVTIYDLTKNKCPSSTQSTSQTEGDTISTTAAS